MSREQRGETLLRYELDADEAPSKGVYSTVAAVENRSPLELTPIADVTDPDALDTLLTGAPETDRISFEYCGYEVTVTAEEVHLKDPED